MIYLGTNTRRPVILPQKFEDLLKLPGPGHYTAQAINIVYLLIY